MAGPDPQIWEGGGGVGWGSGGKLDPLGLTLISK